MIRILTQILLHLIVFFFVYPALGSERISCEHFWDSNGILIKSGLPVGTDVGISTLGPNGEYKCKVHLTLNDTLEGKYLYFGEIGDAAYLIARKGISNEPDGPPITHGLSPNPNFQAHYYRVIPFVVPIRYVYRGDDDYNLEIHYRDIVLGQAGMRSGPPTIETLKGAAFRAISDSLALTYHLVQTLCLIMISIGVLFWSNSSLKRRLCLSLTTLAAAGVIFSITAIPRMLFPDPVIAIKLNNIFHILASAVIFFPLLLITDRKSKIKPHFFLYFQTLLAVGFGIMIYLSDIDQPAHLTHYAIGLFILGGVTPLCLSYAYARGFLITSFSMKQSKSIPVFLLFFSTLILWDIGINVLTLTMRIHFFLQHFLYFLPAILWQTKMYVTESVQIRLFPDLISEIKNKTLQEMAKDKEFNAILNGLIGDVSVLFSSSRSSLIEVSESRVQTLGHYGDYSSETVAKEIDEKSFLKSAINHFQKNNKSNFYYGRKRDEADEENDFYIIHCRIRNIKCFLCLTNFKGGYLAPFIRDRLKMIVSEIELLLSLIFSERDNRSQSIIVQTARLRVHPLQLTSERHFLDHFNISHTVHQPAFLIGDLVDSTPLNRNYGAVKIGQAMDYFLQLLFNEQKGQGLIVSRRNGDEISIIVPNQAADGSSNDALLRLLQIVKSIISGKLLKQAAKRNGIVLPFQFKMVASQADAVLSNDSNVQAVPSFTLLTDSEIDAASRVLTKVALGGECLLMERVGERLSRATNIIQLPKERLRGIQNSQKLFLLNANTVKRTA